MRMSFGRCQVCGNDYDKAFKITTSDGAERAFDSFECAIHALAPVCAHCHNRVIGHGMEKDNKIYCCAHCAQASGVRELQDRA
jgi:hypothetical protein